MLYAIEKWGNMPQTVNSRLRTLRQFFGFLVSEGYLAENPAARVESLKTAETLIVALSKEQVRQLLAVPDRKTFTGLRLYDHDPVTGYRTPAFRGLRTSHGQHKLQ